MSEDAIIPPAKHKTASPSASAPLAKGLFSLCDALPCLAPGSRREARREARRDAILEVAAQSFLEHGYAGTTMSGIAARLGGSKGTLWSYFSSKEVLFGEVIARATEAFRAQLTLLLNPDDPVSTALTGYCRQFLMKLTNPDAIALYRLVVSEAHRFPEMGRIFYEHGPQMTQRMLSDYLRIVSSRGALRLDDPIRAAQQLTYLCMSGSHQRLLTCVSTELPPERIAADADAAVATFLRAYRAPVE